MPVFIYMDIKTIIAEEVQRLFEQKAYRIQDLAQLLANQGYDEQGVGYLAKMLLDAYKQGGDQAVIDRYAEMAGVQIEAVSKGRYMFANLYDPEAQYEASSDERLMEIEDNSCHTPNEMPS